MATNLTTCLLYDLYTNQYMVLRLSEEEINERKGQVNIMTLKIKQPCLSIRYGSLRDQILKMDTNSNICTVCKRSNNQAQVEALSLEAIKARLSHAQTLMLIIQSRLTIHYRLLEGQQKYKAVLEVLWNACEHLQIRTGALKAHLQPIKHTSAEISIFKLTEHITNISFQLSTVSEELLRLCYTEIENLIKYIVEQNDFYELTEDVIHTIINFESFNTNHTDLRMNKEIERQIKMGRTIYCPLTV